MNIGEIEYYPVAMIKNHLCKDVFKCHKDTKICLSNWDMMVERELQENDIVAFTVFFGARISPLYELMKSNKFINTEK